MYYNQEAILGITLGGIFVIFICAICVVMACTVPSTLRRRARARRKADEDVSSPLLADTDDSSAIPLLPLASAPPPSNPAYVVSPTGQAKPVIHEGAPYVPPITFPEGPTSPPLLTYYTPQEPNPSVGYAPDAPPKAIPPLPVQSAPSLNQYPPLAAATPPDTSLSPTATTTSHPTTLPGMSDEEGKAAQAKKPLGMLGEPGRHADLQASLASLSIVGSPLGAGTPLGGSLEPIIEISVEEKGVQEFETSGEGTGGEEELLKVEEPKLYPDLRTAAAEDEDGEKTLYPSLVETPDT